MKFIFNTIQDFEKELKITVSKKTMEIMYKKTIIDIRKTITINGFRKNKIPNDIIQKKYKNEINNNTIQKIIHDNLIEILKIKKIHIINTPRIMIHQYKKNSDFIYSIYFQSIPELDFNKFKLLNIEKKMIVIDDTDVEYYIHQIQKKNIYWKKNNNKIQKGDKVTIYYQIENNNIFDVTKIYKLTFITYTKKIISQIENQLFNKKKNNIILVTIKISKYHPNIKYQNKVLKIKIRIGEIFSPKLKYSRNEFIKLLQQKQCTSDTNFKYTIKNKLKKDIIELQYIHLKQEIINNISQSNIIKIPKNILNQEIKKIKKNNQNKYTEKLENIFKPKYYQNLKVEALKIIKIEFIMKYIIYKNNIHVTKEEIKKYIQLIKKDNSVFPQVIQISQKKQNMMDYIHNVILERKIINYLLPYFKIVHKTCNLRESIYT